MERGLNDSGFVMDYEKNIIGVNLGFDFCAEHE